MKRSTNGNKGHQRNILAEENFPSLNNNSIARPSQASTASKGSYAQQVKFSSGSSNAFFNNLNLVVPDCGSSTMNKIESPFSFEEMMSLTSDILNSLRDVKTASREDVIMAVMQISLKYLYNNGCK